MSCPAAVSFFVHSAPDRSNNLIGRIQLNWKVIMTKAQLKEIRQIMASEYRMAIVCKRSFTPIWYLFV
jgi:hypothetical protein